MERDKLKDLLLEYIDSIGQQERWEIKTEEIISKKFGFIQRLLNNQKIDQEKLDHSLDSCSYIKNDLAGSCIKLIMFLSIQDNPIEFLVSILK